MNAERRLEESIGKLNLLVAEIRDGARNGVFLVSTLLDGVDLQPQEYRKACPLCGHLEDSPDDPESDQ